MTSIDAILWEKQKIKQGPRPVQPAVCAYVSVSVSACVCVRVSVSVRLCTCVPVSMSMAVSVSVCSLTV